MPRVLLLILMMLLLLLWQLCRRDPLNLTQLLGNLAAKQVNQPVLYETRRSRVPTQTKKTTCTK